jgi:Carboxypeptidase regulatory-like domain
MVMLSLPAAMFVAAWFVATAAYGQPLRDAAPRSAAAASISGVVLSDDSPSKPLRRALVVLTGLEMSDGRTVVTNDDGTFAFERLPPDEYEIAAKKDGYVSINFGAARPGRPGRPIALHGAETRSVTLRLPRGSVITGRISDPQGQPVAGVQVDVLSNVFVPSLGERRLISSGLPTTTDDQGVYRMFDLPAGDYLIAAHAFPAISRDTVLHVVSPQEVRRALAELQDGSLQAQPGPPKPAPYKPTNEPRLSVGFAPVFYPGTVVRSQAVTVSVRAGEQRAGVDFDIQFVAAATVSGAVPGLTGVSGPSVALIPESEIVGPDSVRIRRVGAGGAFTFTGVAPGRYTLFARQDATAARSSDARIWGATEIIVDGQDVTGLSLPLQPGLTISGRVVFTAAAPRPSRARFDLPVALTMSGSIEVTPSVQIEVDRRFRMEGIVPGAYRVQRADGLYFPLGRLWLKSVVVNGRDLLDAPIELRQSVDDAVVTLSDRTSEVTGVVTDQQGAALPGETVILFAADKRSWFFNSRRIAVSRTNAQGRYRIRNLPPGEYYAVATGGPTLTLDEGEWFDPVVLEQIARAALPVRLEDDEQKNLNLVGR